MLNQSKHAKRLEMGSKVIVLVILVFIVIACKPSPQVTTPSAPSTPVIEPSPQGIADNEVIKVLEQEEAFLDDIEQDIAILDI